MKALIVAADGFEDIELRYPLYRLLEEEIKVKIATPNKEDILGKQDTLIEPDLSIKEVDSSDFDLLVIPGGKSPEHLRIEAPETIELVKEFNEENKLIGAICHGPQLLMSANKLQKRKATCYWSIRDDLENAGAVFQDKRVVVDENLITSREPDDLPFFMKQIIEELK